MPRTADHDQRRAQIADAAFELLARSGLESATMAAVAERAGLSVGLIQHYFESKDELLLHVYRRTLESQLARAFRLVSAGEAAAERIDDILFTCLQELWPLDRGRREEYRMTRAFHTRSLVSPEVAELARDSGASVRSLVAQSIENGKECGETPSDTAAEAAAVRILALAEGLADQLYREPELRVDGRPLKDVAATTLREALKATFPGECRHHG